MRPARHGPGGGCRPRPPRHRQLPRAGDTSRDPHPRGERAGPAAQPHEAPPHRGPGAGLGAARRVPGRGDPHLGPPGPDLHDPPS